MRSQTPGKSKLKLVVPSVGTFFTPLHLEDAFKYQDRKRFISRRRFVAPSFNDVRLILNTAQVLGLVRSSPARSVELITFDGDLTLYDDGASVTEDSPMIPRIIRLLSQGKKVAIVTAAGYTEAGKYYQRLRGMLDAIYASTALTAAQKNGLVVMGGESNFLFRYDASRCSRSPSDPTSVDDDDDNNSKLAYVPRDEWLLPDMKQWREADINELLDIAESSLRACVSNLNLSVALLRKDRAVGVYPLPGSKLHREQLEETVLAVQNTVERTAVGSRLPFCAFNGLWNIPL